jgi:hypothetical protein
MQHRFAKPEPHVFQGPPLWWATLDPLSGDGRPGCGLLPGWRLEVFCGPVLRYRETYVDRPRVIEDARADADAYMNGRVPEWRAAVVGGLTLEDLDLSREPA